MTNNELKEIRKKISCPQLGDECYGEWGILTKDQRFTIKRMLDYIAAQEDLIKRQKAENERLKNHIQEGIDLAKQLPEMVATVKTEANKEFAKIVTQTLTMFNVQELAGVSKEYNNRYFYENPKVWTEGSTTARNEAIAIVNNFLKELVGE